MYFQKRFIRGSIPGKICCSFLIVHLSKSVLCVLISILIGGCTNGFLLTTSSLIDCYDKQFTHTYTYTKSNSLTLAPALFPSTGPYSFFDVLTPYNVDSTSGIFKVAQERGWMPLVTPPMTLGAI